jgi:hypothetical protein
LGKGTACCKQQPNQYSSFSHRLPPIK